MEVKEYSGIVRQVIDAVNSAYEDGELPTVSDIVLTGVEMDEFMANNPFTGDVGKFYGDEDVPSLRYIENMRNASGEIVVSSFYIKGIRVSRSQA